MKLSFKIILRTTCLNLNHNTLIKTIGLIFILYFITTLRLVGQSSYMPFNDMTYHWLDRFDVIFNNPTNLHFSIKGISRKDVANLAMVIDSLYPDISVQDRADLQWLINQNNDWIPRIPLDCGEKSEACIKTFLQNTRPTF